MITIPLAPCTARAIDLAVGERTGGPVFLAPNGRRLDRHGAGRIVHKAARRAGITKAVTPHTLRHAFITAALDAGVSLHDVQEAASHADPRTTMRYDRARGSLDRHATYVVAAPPGSPHGLAAPVRLRQPKPMAPPRSQTATWKGTRTAVLGGNPSLLGRSPCRAEQGDLCAALARRHCSLT